MAKAILLFSGGLDSLLSYKILKEQGVDVFPVTFESYFFGCGQAKKTAAGNGLEVNAVNIAEDQLKIVKNPEHGRGQHLNPCVDCHFLMLRKAKEIMEAKGADFIATGEVLGQRPFSQNNNTFQMMEKQAGLEGLILRPLSAKLLPETIPEKQGWVKRESLFDFQSKSRKGQLELVKKLGIEYFPQPAGGCLLTDPQFSERLGELLKRKPDFTGADVQILKNGRIFFEDDFFAAVARDQKEGECLAGLRKPEDLLIEPENFAGPAVLIRFLIIATGGHSAEALEKGKKLMIKYSKQDKLPAQPEINIL
ncbi:MAG: tRNA 4-thiouridine(8) synthase ThiI [Candidatus Paceibacterota bacterium]|jgi:tRNA U34 2-thiouridine synthase MnmA/TrmU